MNNKFQIFGSASSKDYDVIVFVDSLGTIQESHDAVTVFENELIKILNEYEFYKGGTYIKSIYSI